ncbi:MAG: hypothetical protein P1U89_25620 [Verrucomicrobiales bacterium]|nr:hypothetical protein [Verrucomicrobiales bacterium]
MNFFLKTLILPGLSLLLSSNDTSAVEGRYICFGNGLSPIIGVAEFEVWSGGTNVVANRAEDFELLCLTGRDPESNAAHFRNMVDGNKNTLERWPRTLERNADGMGYKDGALSLCAFEVDLKKTMPIDRIEFYRSRYMLEGKPFKLFQDLGWRYLLVLNEDRQIVAWNTFNIYPDDWKERKGHWTFIPEPAKGAPAGRVVPKGSLNWLSEAEYIRDFLGKPMIDRSENLSGSDRERLQRFQRRNDPGEIEKLGETFFRIVDLERPGLEAVKALVKEKRYGDALNAFKEPFFKTAGILKEVHGDFEYSWMCDSNSRSGMRARDLMNQVYGDKTDLTVKKFSPGLLPPGPLEFPFQMRPLLLNYASTGELKALRMWESMTDDWALGYQDAADRDPKKLRDIFVLDGGTVMDNLLDLVNASQDNPEFIRDLSGATLARFLMPILEEFPVAIWRVCRTCTFNHTYNAVPGGLLLSEAIMDFHAGQRLNREMREAFLRLFTYNTYRDGTMVEVGDEGHYMSVVVSPGNLYGLYNRIGRPDWFSPAVETYFLDHYRANVLSHARNISPSGAHVRWSTMDNSVGPVELELGLRDLAYRKPSDADYYATLCRPILTEPEPLAIIDTVYGRGRKPFEEEPRAGGQKSISEFFSNYTEEYAGPPEYLSDWMPYAGLWYFRGGWNHEDSLLHMVHPTSPNCLGGAGLYPVTNTYGQGKFNTTSYRFHDYASPLMTGLGVLIDNLPPCPEEGRTPSGSKQSVFSRASEKPQSSRWYSDEILDFGEAVYRGSYRDEGEIFDHKLRKRVAYSSPERVGEVTSSRQIFQVRPAKLFLQVDRIRYANAEEKHTQTLTNTMIVIDPDDTTEATVKQITVDRAAHTIESKNPGNAGMMVKCFGQAGLDMQLNEKEIGHQSFRRSPTITLNGYRKTKGYEVKASWEGEGETVLISLLRALRPGEAPIKKTEDLSDDEVAGVRATMSDDAVITLLISRRDARNLEAGPMKIHGEGLLLFEQSGQPLSGLVLGAGALWIAGNKEGVKIPDFQFQLDSEGFQQIAMQRPVDPPTIGPAETTFTDSTLVSITADTPDATIEYIAETVPDEGRGSQLDGPKRCSVNADNWTVYNGPFKIEADTFIRARAVRNGVTRIPMGVASTDVSAISYGFFDQQSALPAIEKVPDSLTGGLNYDYLEGRWFALWTYADRLPAVKSGTTEDLLDVSMRETDQEFGVRYHGYIEVPEDGVYTFYAPEEYIDNSCEPGYDLRVYIDGQEWEIGQTWHGLGRWSVPLQKGLHRFVTTFADARAKDLEAQRIDLAFHYPWPETTWKGVAPVLEVSGPNLKRQTLPKEWLKR